MSKFKVGGKVRRINCANYSNSKKIIDVGDVGAISSITDDGLSITLNAYDGIHNARSLKKKLEG